MSWFIETKTDRYGNPEKSLRVPRLVTSLVVFLFVIITLCNCFSIIPSGYTGVRTTFGQISETVMPNGINFKIPYVQSIAKVNNKLQDVVFYSSRSGDAKLWGETSEKVPVYLQDITVTYQINAEKSAWIYRNVTDYTQNLVSTSIVSSACKDAAVQLLAEEVTTRSKIEALSLQRLQQYLDEKYGANTVTVIKCSIANMDFEASYNEAITQRSLAQKQRETQIITNETNIAKAEADAKVKLKEAQAAADAQVIAAKASANALLVEATAQAEANEKINKSITTTLINYTKIKKWDGKLPSVTGANSLIGINLED